MNNQPKIIALIALLSICAIILAIFFIKNRNDVPKEITKNSEKINVLVSILPQKELVEKIGGDRVTVSEIVHPGESPATYSLTAQDLIAIEESDVYFRIGHIPFEQANIEKIVSTNPSLTVVQIPEQTHLRYFGTDDTHEEENHETATESIHNHDINIDDHTETHEVSHDDHEHTAESIDPHLWLSIENMILHTNSIAQELSTFDPENASFYTQNAQTYKKELSQLKSEISNSLSQLTNKNLLVFHPAWGYFADEHGLTQIAIEDSGNDPTAEQLSAIIDSAREKNINVIFVQSQFSTVAAESIADELNIPVVQIDPLSEEYIANMRIISEVIHKNLQ